LRVLKKMNAGRTVDFAAQYENSIQLSADIDVRSRSTETPSGLRPRYRSAHQIDDNASPVIPRPQPRDQLPQLHVTSAVWCGEEILRCAQDDSSKVVAILGSLSNRSHQVESAIDGHSDS
jgi:hypothetical protein